MTAQAVLEILENTEGLDPQIKNLLLETVTCIEIIRHDRTKLREELKAARSLGSSDHGAKVRALIAAAEQRYRDLETRPRTEWSPGDRLIYDAVRALQGKE